jgi:hypothetical protein
VVRQRAVLSKHYKFNEFGISPLRYRGGSSFHELFDTMPFDLVLLPAVVWGDILGKFAHSHHSQRRFIGGRVVVAPALPACLSVTPKKRFEESLHQKLIFHAAGENAIRWAPRAPREIWSQAVPVGGRIGRPVWGGVRP